MLTLLTMTKNEEKVLPRLIESANNLVDRIVVVDTGSTDDTVDVAEALGAEVVHDEWMNFGLNRTKAAYHIKEGWFLFLDADMTVWAEPNFKQWLFDENNGALSNGYNVQIFDGNLQYRLPLLLRGNCKWEWVGSTHEYLSPQPLGNGLVYGIMVRHHADGGSRIEKHERDLELLAPGVSYGDPRSVYYSAQAHWCLGNIDEAIEMYLWRANMEDTFEEERWHAKYRAGHLMLDQGDLNGIHYLLSAYNERPTRAEPLKVIADWANTKRVKDIPQEDLLFIEPAAYY